MNVATPNDNNLRKLEIARLDKQVGDLKQELAQLRKLCRNRPRLLFEKDGNLSPKLDKWFKKIDAAGREEESR